MYKVMLIKSFMKYLCFIFIFIFLNSVSAQDNIKIFKAKVVEVLDQKIENIPEMNIKNNIQTIKIEILNGEKKGNILTIENDYLMLEEGDNFFLTHKTDSLDNSETYSVKDIDRRFTIFIFIALFIIVVCIFSGKQGLRSILGLMMSFFIIIYVLIPSLLRGYSPMITSIIVATIILFLAIYFTHGFNKVSTIAFLGTVIAVTMTGFLAYIGVNLAQLTGFVTEEAFYLNINTYGALDFKGLLLGGIIIGVLGVLDDIAITQAAIVRELFQTDANLSKRQVYKKALRVGKEHVGALVNTLALAYTGASLPLLLLFSSSNIAGASVINQEVFATEIIRTIVGSIGLILTVPITTFLAVCFLKDYKGKSIKTHSCHSH